MNSNRYSILKELITSIDNTPRLKEFYNTKTNEIKTSLTELNKTVKDKATQIKIQEVVKILPTIDKTSKVKDDDLINDVKNNYKKFIMLSLFSLRFWHHQNDSKLA